MIFFKKHLTSKIVLQKTSKNFVWCQIDKSLVGTDKHLYLCGAYIPPENSHHYSNDLFEELENDISHFRSKGKIMLLGDLNARTGKSNDYITADGNHFLCSGILEEQAAFAETRNNLDNNINNHGKFILEICKNFDIRILNGRFRGDSLGNFTYHGRNGNSTIDYIFCDQMLFNNVEYFIVKQPTYLSDHSQIVVWIKTPSLYI